MNPEVMTLSSLADAARDNHIAYESKHVPGSWTSSSIVFENGAPRNFDYPLQNADPTLVTVPDCGLLEGHFPCLGNHLVHARMHHNSEHKIKSLVDVDGAPTKLLSQIVRSCRGKPVNRGSYFLVSGRIDNIWHFICNYLFRLNWIDVERPMKFVVASDLKPHFIELLEYAGVPRDQLFFVKPGSYERFEELTVCECPFSLFNGALFGDRMAGQLFRNRLGAHRRRTRRIYISRRDAIWRKVVNENDVMTLLGRYGFELIELSGMPIRQMIDLMASAEVVVGPSGANLSGAMFCQPGSAVVELTFEPYIRKYYFQATSTISECRHYKVRGTPLSNPENYTRWDFSVPLPELESAIRMAIDNIS